MHLSPKLTHDRVILGFGFVSLVFIPCFSGLTGYCNCTPLVSWEGTFSGFDLRRQQGNGSPSCTRFSPDPQPMKGASLFLATDRLGQVRSNVRVGRWGRWKQGSPLGLGVQKHIHPILDNTADKALNGPPAARLWNSARGSGTACQISGFLWKQD